MRAETELETADVLHYHYKSLLSLCHYVANALYAYVVCQCRCQMFIVANTRSTVPELALVILHPHLVITRFWFKTVWTEPRWRVTVVLVSIPLSFAHSSLFLLLPLLVSILLSFFHSRLFLLLPLPFSSFSSFNLSSCFRFFSSSMTLTLSIASSFVRLSQNPVSCHLGTDLFAGVSWGWLWNSHAKNSRSGVPLLVLECPSSIVKGDCDIGVIWHTVGGIVAEEALL